MEMEGEQKEQKGAGKIEDNSFQKLVNIAVVIMLVGLIFIALYTFFFDMQEAINTLVITQYAPLVRAIFSLVVIGVGVYLVKMFLSR
jgi:predicted transporter